MVKSFIPTHGGYGKLISYQKAEIVYDATEYFTARFFQKGNRTIDQMIQAARSGKQNIAEASQASGTSKEFEIKLTSVARASQEELLLDYRDFLRSRKLTEWSINHQYTIRLRELNKIKNSNYETFRKGIENEDPEICANVIMGLIKVTTFLLDKQIETLELEFINQGGIRERMSKARNENRNR